MDEVYDGMLEKFAGDGTTVAPDGVDIVEGYDYLKENMFDKLRPLMALPGDQNGYKIGTRPLDSPVPNILASILDKMDKNHRQVYSINSDDNFGKFDDSKVRQDLGHKNSDYQNHSLYGDFIFNKDIIDKARRNIDKKRELDDNYRKYNVIDNNCINYNIDLINDALDEISKY